MLCRGYLGGITGDEEDTRSQAYCVYLLLPETGYGRVHFLTLGSRGANVPRFVDRALMDSLGKYTHAKRESTFFHKVTFRIENEYLNRT